MSFVIDANHPPLEEAFRDRHDEGEERLDRRLDNDNTIEVDVSSVIIKTVVSLSPTIATSATSLQHDGDSSSYRSSLVSPSPSNSSLPSYVASCADFESDEIINDTYSDDDDTTTTSAATDPEEQRHDLIQQELTDIILNSHNDVNDDLDDEAVEALTIAANEVAHILGSIEEHTSGPSVIDCILHGNLLKAASQQYFGAYPNAFMAKFGRMLRSSAMKVSPSSSSSPYDDDNATEEEEVARLRLIQHELNGIIDVCRTTSSSSSNSCSMLLQHFEQEAIDALRIAANEVAHIFGSVTEEISGPNVPTCIVRGKLLEIAAEQYSPITDSFMVLYAPVLKRVATQILVGCVGQKYYYNNDEGYEYDDNDTTTSTASDFPTAATTTANVAVEIDEAVVENVSHPIKSTVPQLIANISAVAIMERKPLSFIKYVTYVPYDPKESNNSTTIGYTDDLLNQTKYKYVTCVPYDTIEKQKNGDCAIGHCRTNEIRSETKYNIDSSRKRGCVRIFGWRCRPLPNITKKVGR